MKGIVWTGELEVRDDVAVRDPRPHEVRVRIHNGGLVEMGPDEQVD